MQKVIAETPNSATNVLPLNKPVVIYDKNDTGSSFLVAGLAIVFVQFLLRSCCCLSLILLLHLHLWCDNNVGNFGNFP